jgi:putative endonuclease
MNVPAPSRWPWLRRWFGNRSERAAERFLKRLGYRILRRNYLCPSGELDLVALDGRCLVFAEVRSTANPDSERAALSIDREKQRRMTQAALHFMRRFRLRDPVCRFDTLIISWPDSEREPKIDHCPHAFEAVGRFQMDS